MPYRQQSARIPLGCSAAGIPERQPQSDEHLQQERRRRRTLQPRRWKTSGTRLPVEKTRTASESQRGAHHALAEPWTLGQRQKRKQRSHKRDDKIQGQEADELQ